MKLIRNQSTVIVVMDDGVVLQSTKCTDEMFEQLKTATPDEVILIMKPSRAEKIVEAKQAESLLERVHKSKILCHCDDFVYMYEVGMLSMPKELVERIITAEENNDEDALESYKNFWTLMSLNPDPLCRENLFKFLTKWGMTISKTGLFVGYRNVDVKFNDTYNKIYTDHHSHSFEIKIGEMVTMPRENCDSDSRVSCSRGLMCSPLGE